MRDRIYITEADFEKLRLLVEGRRSGRGPDPENLDTLEQELDRADVVEAEAIPRDVVTMNSEVRLKDLDSGDIKVYRLVFPSQARVDTTISILAPIGIALLGYRVGDTIEWRVPKGIRRLKVLDVLYQPEAAGVSGD
ncbi:MAG: nucleoside diphosphate kinase regulator [Bryobacterales bacterium]|nr:nucleoside diphosphate kinase regulator [Bryobacterales bacterium]